MAKAVVLRMRCTPVSLAENVKKAGTAKFLFIFFVSSSSAHLPTQTHCQVLLPRLCRGGSSAVGPGDGGAVGADGTGAEAANGDRLP